MLNIPGQAGPRLDAIIAIRSRKKTTHFIIFRMNESGKLIAVIGDEDTVTGFVLAGVGHRTVEGQNFLVVKSGSYNNKFSFIYINDFN